MAKAYTFTDLATPANPAAVAAAGGSLTASTTYYYRVIAVFNTSSESNVFARRELGRSFACTEVSATTDATNKTINLSWDAVAGAGAYRVWRSTTSGEYGVCLMRSVKTNSYSDDGSDTMPAYMTKFWEKAHGKLAISGGTVSDPITIQDLYAEDQANGWGVITQDIEGVYEISTYLDVTGYFTALSCTVIMNYPWIVSTTAGTVTFGELTAQGLARNGCNVIVRCSNGFGIFTPFSAMYELNLYDTRMYNDYKFWPGFQLGSSPLYYSSRYQALNQKNGTIKDSTMTHFRSLVPVSGFTNNMSNVVFSFGEESIWNFDTNGTIDDLQVVGCGKGLQQSTIYTMTLKGLKLIGCSRDIRMYNPTTGWIKLINSAINENSISWVLVPEANEPYIDEWFEFDLKVQDSEGNAIEGATVVMVDVDEGAVFSTTTSSSGSITQQEVKYKRHTYGGARDSSVEVLTTNHATYTPHTITISKAGYQTKTVVLTMDRKREEVETLEKAVPFIVVDGERLVLNASPSKPVNSDGWVGIE